MEHLHASGQRYGMTGGLNVTLSCQLGTTEWRGGMDSAGGGSVGSTGIGASLSLFLFALTLHIVWTPLA